MTFNRLRAMPAGSEARRFPCRYAYTPDRFAWAVYHMPGGRWDTGDSTESETRIAALARNRRQRL